jgi:hypothetical protein
LLSPVPGGGGDGDVTVFDYLVDLVQQGEGPLAQVAEPVIRAALDHVQHPEDADQIAATADRQGRYHLAEPAWPTTLALRWQTLGEEHPDTLARWGNLALVLRDLGRLEEAEAENWTVLEIQDRQST